MPQNTEKWGKATAKARYGSGPPTFSPPSGKECYPQFPEDKQGPKYSNETSGWVVGAGGTAENKPGFDRSKKRG